MKTKSGFLVNACVVAACIALSLSNARANVYATDIQVNGNLTNTPATNGSPVAISYRLNQTADLGVTVNILNGTNVVASIPGGTNMGLNTVSWTPSSGFGTFAVNITAAASGFASWTQISFDTNAGMTAFDPQGIDVDKNTNSPYYGRVIMSCGKTGSATGAQRDGFYKMNADGSQADEGWYGYAGYAEDDYGNPPIAGQMPDSSEGGGLSFNPLIVRIGDDDRIYWVDNTAIGAILSCDILASTNNGYEVVIDEGTLTASSPFGYTAAGMLQGPHNYAHCPDAGDLITSGGDGIAQFDVTGTTTSHGAVWLVDVEDSPNWGVWMFHLTNGVSDTNDTVGTKAVATGGILAGTSSGVMVDSNLDIFIGQNITTSGATNARAVEFRRWGNGTLPPEGGRYSYAVSNEPAWYAGGGSTTLLNIRDTVIDSRANPKYVALPMESGSVYNGGITVLNAANGSAVVTNIDYGNQYTCAAWDGVGNLYGASPSAGLWRVFSPPGANTNTTLAVAQIILPGPPPPPVITGISAVTVSPGCATVTITFTAAGNPATSALSVVGSATLTGTYTPVAGVSITGSNGSYQAVFVNCSTQFFEIAEQ